MAVALHAYPICTNAAQGMVRLGMHRLARVVVMPSFEPEGFGALVEQHRPSMLTLVPATALMLLNWGALMLTRTPAASACSRSHVSATESVLRRPAEQRPHMSCDVVDRVARASGADELDRRLAVEQLMIPIPLWRAWHA
jgi:hypothetical protein